MRLLARGGLESISLRHVATEAGVSTGQVQHYFPSRDAMMEFATSTIAERIATRITAAGPDLRQLLTALLPTDPESAADARILIGYLAFASVRPQISETLATNGLAFRDHVATMLPHHPDPTSAAESLLALLDGLAIHVTIGQLAPDKARVLLSAAIDAAQGSRGSEAPG